MPERPSKACQRCGRAIEWRKKWESDWEGVRYCSTACRRSRTGDVDAALEAAVLALLRARARDASVCPSEAARAVDPAGWRELMERARNAARRLASRGVVEIIQSGRVVNGSTARGPVLVRLAR